MEESPKSFFDLRRKRLRHPIPPEPQRLDRSLSHLVGLLHHLAEILTWWGRQAVALASRVTAAGPWTWGLQDDRHHEYHAGIVALLRLGSALAAMGEDCRAILASIEDARVKLETREPDKHSPNEWNGCLRQATAHRWDEVIDDDAVAVGVEAVEQLQSILEGALINEIGGDIGDEALAIERDVQGLLRLPKHLQVLQASIEGTLDEATCEAKRWAVSERNGR